MSSSASPSPASSTTSSTRTKRLSQQGRDMLLRAASGPSSLVLGHTDLLSKLAFTAAGKKTKEAKMWTEEEDNLLRAAIEKYGEDWAEVVKDVPGRNKLQCVQRWKKTLRPGLTKGPWKPEEDALLLQVMTEEEEGDWQSIARRIPGRNAKQCKERWTLNLNPDINHGPWTPEEDAALVQLHSEIGGKWSVLAKRLTGRTEHSIKTRFLSLQRQAAKVRGWTVEEDRIVLKQFMLAPQLDGGSAAVKALQGRTKKQVVQRWQYLRERYVSIDDLATSSYQGNVLLTDQDLRMLIPHPSLVEGVGDPLAMQQQAASSFPPMRPSAVAHSAASKALARRQGSSTPSQPYRHVSKKLEKSTSSSSTSSRVPGMELLQAAYGSSTSSAYNPVVANGNDPFVTGLEKSMLEMTTSGLTPSLSHISGKFGSSSSSSATNGNGVDVHMTTGMQRNNNHSSRRASSSFAKKTLGMFPLSSSFIFNQQPSSSSALQVPASPEFKPTVSRTDSFLALADELEQLAQHKQQQQGFVSSTAAASSLPPSSLPTSKRSHGQPQLTHQHSSSFMDLPLLPPVSGSPFADDADSHLLRPSFSSSFLMGTETGFNTSSSLQRASSSQQQQADYPVAMYRPGAADSFIANNEYMPTSLSPMAAASFPQYQSGFTYPPPPPPPPSQFYEPPAIVEERKALRQFASSITGPGTGSTNNSNLANISFDIDGLDMNLFNSPVPSYQQ